MSSTYWLSIDPLSARVAQVLLLAVFAGGLLHKLRDWRDFAQALDGYRLIASWAQQPAAFGLISTELAAIVLVALPSTRQLGASLMLALLLLYTGAIAINLARGRTSFDCGCGWGAAASGVSRISGWLIYRNLFVVCAALVVMMPADARVLQRLDMLIIVLAGTAATVIYVFADRLIHNWHHLTASRAGP